MRMLFVMDPIDTISLKKDTSFGFMEAAQARGHRLAWCRIEELSAEGGQGWARCREVQVQRVAGAHHRSEPPALVPLSDFDVVWMRKDPPFSMNYIYATYLLDQVDPARTRVINWPSGLRSCNEKAVILRFPAWTPATAVAWEREDIDRWVGAWGGRAVLKPLDGMGGRGILLLDHADPNYGSLIEVSTAYGTTPVMVQRFVPEASEGDKRILLWDGEILGGLLRKPKAGELRSNLAAGGSASATAFSADEQAMVEELRPFLRAQGLRFVGLDVIGGKLTELNVTSPTGMMEASQFAGRDLCAEVVARLERGQGWDDAPT